MKAWLIAIGTALALTGCATRSELAVAPAPPEAIRGVHHVGITVSDIDDTVAFYRQVVPFELVERRMVPARAWPAEILAKRTGSVEMALIRTPTVFLQLIDVDPAVKEPPQRRPATGPGYTHICWQTPSSDPGYDRFRRIGLDMLSRGDGPVDLGGYGVTYAYGHDHDGIMIEMEQVDRPRRDDRAWLTHVANVTGDKTRMVEFYSGILGHGPHRELPVSRRKTFDDVVDIDDVAIAASWFATWNFEIELWHYESPRTPLAFTPRMLDTIGYNSVSFEVSDLAGTVARLAPQDMRWAGEGFELGGWRMRYARDPEGNLIAFQQNLSAGADRSIETMRWHDPATFGHR